MTENENHERSYYMSIGNNRGRRSVGEHFRRRSFDDTKHFPPPMPLLTHSGSLPAHMPWFFKRSYTDNGRLVLKEVKAKHHQFFCARRVNGRLTLRLMHSSECSSRNPDDLIEEDKDEEHEQEQEQEQEQGREDEKSENESGKRMVGLSLVSSSSSTTLPLVPLLLTDGWPNEGDLCIVKKTNKEMSRAASSPSLLSLGGRTESPPIGVGGGGGVCFPIRRTGSLLKMSMPTIRPVHS